ncbi:MAG: tannase/feruloyl esterase family alpha/beta hydrolase [Acidobacteria bacterium]|nr:tannase/feruloyl esterase family alpha/beta hydrolase [Acidobacteriota bacterium]
MSPSQTLMYYDAVRRTTGGQEQTDRFARLYLIPGMSHRGGGPTPNNSDMLLQSSVGSRTARRRTTPGGGSVGVGARSEQEVAHPVNGVDMALSGVGRHEIPGLIGARRILRRIGADVPRH